MAKKNLQKIIKSKRLGQWIRVNIRFTRRKIRRFFTGDHFRKSAGGSYAKRLYAVSAIGVLCIAALFGVRAYVRRYENGERLIVQKLSYTQDYDKRIAYFRTLERLGASNHLCVSVKTTAGDNFTRRDTSLQSGGVNLKLTFKDGTNCELALQNRHHPDAFFAGRESNFFVTLPFGYTPFDIGECALVLTPGADGSYGSWSCDWANVSVLLGGRRVTIARESWSTATQFGAGNDRVRSITLSDSREENQSFQQYALLFEAMNRLSERGLTDFGDQTLVQKTLSSLEIPSATALYLDVETVSAARAAEIADSNKALPEDELNYNGLLYVDISFSGKLSDGSYTKRYTADTPGKDDFELGSASTFRFEMPEGKTVFDIVEVRISVSNASDAWAPRFMRLYLPLDYDAELELARLTDAALEKEYDSAVFCQGMIDKAVSFDLSAQNAVPETMAAQIQKNFKHTLSGAPKSMYFDRQSFYARQILFFQQMDKLYASGEETDA